MKPPSFIFAGMLLASSPSLADSAKSVTDISEQEKCEIAAVQEAHKGLCLKLTDTDAACIAKNRFSDDQITAQIESIITLGRSSIWGGSGQMRINPPKARVHPCSQGSSPSTPLENCKKDDDLFLSLDDELSTCRSSS